MRQTKVARHMRRTKKGRIVIRHHRRRINLPKQVGKYHVKYVDNILKDYAGMNHYAGKDIGFAPNPAPDTILIDKDMKVKDKVETLQHELVEVEEMKKGKSYWEAHNIALKKERDKPLWVGE